MPCARAGLEPRTAFIMVYTVTITNYCKWWWWWWWCRNSIQSVNAEFERPPLQISKIQLWCISKGHHPLVFKYYWRSCGEDCSEFFMEVQNSYYWSIFKCMLCLQSGQRFLRCYKSSSRGTGNRLLPSAAQHIRAVKLQIRSDSSHHAASLLPFLLTGIAYYTSFIQTWTEQASRAYIPESVNRALIGSKTDLWRIDLGEATATCLQLRDFLFLLLYFTLLAQLRRFIIFQKILKNKNNNNNQIQTHHENKTLW